MRIDLSEQLIHLTRGPSLSEAEADFRSIMGQRKLRGSSKGIRGGHKVVCFSEAPIGILAKLFGPESERFRYRPFGVMVPKAWLFERGGRPVIYQPEAEFAMLPKPLEYRHVRFDAPGGDGDFTFEREWRLQTEELELDPAFCTLVVPHREWDYRLREEFDVQDSRKSAMLGFGPFGRVSRFEWHILALGDIGANLSLRTSSEAQI